LQIRPLFPSRSQAPSPHGTALDRLRESIRALQGHAPLEADDAFLGEAWSAGPGLIRLDPRAVHELKPESAGAAAHGAAIGFALRLVLRRLEALAASGNSRAAHHVLWCWSHRMAHEAGRLYGPGLIRLGIDPTRLIIVETARTADTLWALEEGLRSKGLAIAVGLLPEITLTPVRRLALAAEEGRTPALLVTDNATAPAASTASRWRVAPRPAAPHPFDKAAPGAPRFSATLERCRSIPGSEHVCHVLEWSHDTHRFRMAADVAHRAPSPARGPQRKWASRRRTG
jgi:protein ImuA